MDDFSEGKMLLRKRFLKISKITLVFMLLLFCPLNAQEFSLDREISNVKKRSTEMKVPRVNQDPNMVEEAKKTYNYTQSPEFKQKIEKFKEDLSLILGVNPSEQNQVSRYYSDLEKLNKRKNLLADDERIYIFISSSMPEQTIRNYIKDASEIGDNVYLILRGAIGGIKQLTPTAIWANNLLKKNPLCEIDCEMYRTKILIDPFLYRKYNITKVPAVVYVKGLQNIEGLSEGLDSVKIENFWVSYGDVSFSHHLSLIEEKAGKVLSPK